MNIVKNISKTLTQVFNKFILTLISNNLHQSAGYIYLNYLVPNNKKKFLNNYIVQYKNIAHNILTHLEINLISFYPLCFMRIIQTLLIGRLFVLCNLLR